VYEVLAESWRGSELGSKRSRKKKQASSANPPAADEEKEEKEKEKEKKKPFPPRICLHSYSGPPDTLKMYLHPSVPARIFASFSSAVNLGSVGVDEETPAAFAALIRGVPDDVLLVESDMNVAGDEMDARMEDIVRRVCKVKGWGLEDGVARLGRNWRAFVFGDE
jgi:Tat protein secretion system quality control protein TatD with DNase activity